MLDLAFRDYGVHCVATQMDSRNGTSARPAHRLGIQREAHLRWDWCSKGEWADTLLFGLLATDPKVGTIDSAPAAE